MEFEKYPIDGPLLIKPRIFKDERGWFAETFVAKTFLALGITDNFVQHNQSVSKKNVLRGLHFQNPPYAQSKLVRVIAGSALDVLVDIRKNSAHYGRHIKVVLNDKDCHMLYVPEGFAHGFLALEENTVFSYLCGHYYDKASEDSLFWNDKDLNIDWGISQPILSEKDREAKAFHNFKSPF